MSQQLLQTALYDLHISMGAKMVPFAGYEMPVQYSLGVKKEHLHCRQAAGLFDVSHMGQIRLRGKNAAKMLENLMPVDIIDLGEGKQRYGFFTNEQGGIEDDLMITNFGDHWLLVVNAACKTQDIAHLRHHLIDGVELDVVDDRALLALQGPKAVDILATLNPQVRQMVFMEAVYIELLGYWCYVSRSGYTGEDGFEISVANDHAAELAMALLAFDDVEWIGLGARDSLRLESGLCLYGHELNVTTTPTEAGLLWGISKSRRVDGIREGGFIGDEVILSQIANKTMTRQRIGLVGQTKAPVREGSRLFDENDNEVGMVTSGTFSPSLSIPIAMAYVSLTECELGTLLFADVRGKKLPMTVTKMPFVTQRYYRGV